MADTERAAHPPSVTISSDFLGSDDEQTSLEKFNEMLSDLGPYDILICFFILISGVCCAWQSLAYLFLVHLIKCNPLTDGKITYDFAVDCMTMVQRGMNQSIFLIGSMIGCLFFGHFADQNGRRPNFLTASMIMLIMSLLAGFTPWFWFYCLTRFFLGFGCGGMVICSFVFLVEYVDFRKREIITVIYQIPYAVGYTTLPTFAHFIQDIHNFQLAISVSGIICISYFWIIPESPRWLLLTGYIDKCAAVLQHSAKNKEYNFERLQEIVRKAHMELKLTKLAKSGTMADLFRTLNMLKKTCILSFAWLTLFFKFYGIWEFIVHIDSKNDHIHFNLGCGGWLTVLGTVVSFPVLKYCTRRKALYCTFTLSAIFIFSIFLTKGDNPLVLSPQRLLAIVVLGLCSISFVTLRIFSTELFPTVVRNSGLGLTFCVGRIGTIIGPLIFESLVENWTPLIVYAFMSLMTAVMIIFLPETKGTEIPDTIEESEHFGIKRSTEQP